MVEIPGLISVEQRGNLQSKWIVITKMHVIVVLIRNIKAPGPRPNIKTVIPGLGIPITKMRRSSDLDLVIFIMMTSSNGNIFRVTGPLCGEFTGPGEFPTQRPVTRSFRVFFDLRLNKRLSKQPWGWWLQTQSWSSWRHCNILGIPILVRRRFVLRRTQDFYK